MNEGYEKMAKMVRDAARAVTYHKGEAATLEDVINWGYGHKFDGISRQFIEDQCEIAGLAVWLNT